MKGIVVDYKPNFGATIKVEGKDFLYIADKKVLEKGGVSNPEIGQPIIFQEGNQQGNRVKVRKILSEEMLNHEDMFEKITLPERSEKYLLNGNLPFTNPYSFVPVVAPLEGKINEFRRPFVSHNKFEEFSGIISCRLKTLTPFFISGTHGEEERGQPKYLDFF